MVRGAWRPALLHAAGRELRGAGPCPALRIPAERFLEEERRARAAGLEVVGFFHSHPGHPPDPSAFDRERAWPYYSYLIVGLGPGGVTEIRSWRMEAEGGALEPEPCSVEQDAAKSGREQMK